MQEQVDKDIPVITLSLYNYTQLQDTIETPGCATLEQEDLAYLRKITLVQQLILYLLLIRIIHLLSTGAEKASRKDSKVFEVLRSNFCSHKGRDNHLPPVMENQSQPW